MPSPAPLEKERKRGREERRRKQRQERKWKGGEMEKRLERGDRVRSAGRWRLWWWGVNNLSVWKRERAEWTTCKGGGGRGGGGTTGKGRTRRRHHQHTLEANPTRQTDNASQKCIVWNLSSKLTKDRVGCNNHSCISINNTAMFRPSSMRLQR